MFDTRPIDRGDEFLRHKTTRRDRYDEARERFPEAYDVLLWNRLGQLCESTIANLVVEIDNEYRTPPVEAGLLPGTMRAELLDRGDIVEAMVTYDDLREADRVWLINSVRGWVEIEIDHASAPGRLRRPAPTEAEPSTGGAGRNPATTQTLTDSRASTIARRVASGASLIIMWPTPGSVTTVAPAVAAIRSAARLGGVILSIAPRM